MWRPLPPGCPEQRARQLFKVDLNAAPGAKRTPFAAAICTGAPVCGLRPVRAARDVGTKLPKPRMLTLSPALAASMTASTKALSALSAWRFSRPALRAMSSINSLLFKRDTSRRLGKLGKLVEMKEVSAHKVKHLRLARPHRAQHARCTQNCVDNARGAKNPYFAGAIARARNSATRESCARNALKKSSTNFASRARSRAFRVYARRSRR